MKYTLLHTGTSWYYPDKTCVLLKLHVEGRAIKTHINMVNLSCYLFRPGLHYSMSSFQRDVGLQISVMSDWQPVC